MFTGSVSTSGKAITNCVDCIILVQSKRTIKIKENDKMTKKAQSLEYLV